jgi:hypothetical protein
MIQYYIKSFELSLSQSKPYTLRAVIVVIIIFLNYYLDIREY